jgi:hypothetical protein
MSASSCRPPWTALHDVLHARGASLRTAVPWRAWLLAFWVHALCAATAHAQVSVWTHHNDNRRTGANLNETVLNTTNVNVGQFGQLFSYVVDADVYAQPLVVPGVTIPGKGVHNVVYVATQNDSVYAFDADSNAGNNAQPLWQVNFTNPAAGITPVPAVDVTASNSGNIRRPGPIGIMGTPVIDLSTGTMYLVARTKENGAYFQRLHALDITTGAEKFGGPVAIQATAAGNTFDPMIQNQRPGLALDHGIVYIAWSSHDDMGPYHGWVIGYQASNLQQTGVFNDTPNGTQGGIWQSGQPPAVDTDGTLYLTTGNGTFTMASGGLDASMSFVKLRTFDLALLDWFAQCDLDSWNSEDYDLDSAGVLLIPNTSRVLGGGKQGRYFLLDTGNLGQIQQYGAKNCTNPQIPQSFQASTGGHIHGSPVYYASPTRGPLVYVWAEEDYLKAFAFNGSTFNTTPVTTSTFTAAPGMPGGFLSLSANGSQAGTGILWASMPLNQDAENNVVAGILRAFDASNLSVELWNSRMNPLRDDIGNFAKFVPPTIANGKVYAATFSNNIVVYGLNPPAAPVEIRFIQVAAATPQQGATTVPVAYVNPQIAGDTNIVVVGWNDTTASVQSVTDSVGNSYALAVGPTQTTGLTQAIYYAKNVIGGNNTVTVRFKSSATFADVRILEYSGLDPVSPLDVTAAAVGNSALSSSGSVTTTVANELLFAANVVATGTTQSTSPFVVRIITSPDGDVAQDAIVSATGSFNASASLSSPGPWVMQLAAFKGVSAQGSGPKITSVAPTSGATGGGTAVTITGTGFASGATVSFGGTAATNVSVVSSTSMTATTPAHVSGSVNVVVTNPDGQTGTLAAGFTYSTSSPAPTLSAVSPASGSTGGGTTVQVTGTNFVSGAVVSFGGTPASGVTFVSPTTLTATTPAHASGAANVVVTNPDGQSATLSGGFTYVAPPTVTGVSPGSGSTAGGTVVTISGTNFATGATVSFGGASATGVTVVSATSITATTPAHAAGAVSVVVTNPSGLSGTLSSGFTYGSAAPTVTGVVPNSGPTTGATSVQVTGTNFASGATVSFGGTAATGVTVLNATTLNATTSAHAAGAVNVVVTNPDGQSATLSGGFTYVALPTVTGISPGNGSTAGGTVVTISGTNFATGASVSLGGTSATGVTVVSATSITASTPAHAAGAVSVVVTNPGGLSGTLPSGFTYVAPPTVTGVSPGSGSSAGGTVVTISGTNFATGASVSFGGTSATGVTVVSASSITATTPAHAAGAVSVVVTNPGGLSGTLSSGFTYSASAPAPTVTGVAPNNGPSTGATSVQVTGTNFVFGATVSFGGTAATGVTVVNATTLNASTPAHAIGAVNVVVTNPDGQSGTLPNGFTYGQAPIAFVRVSAATPQTSTQTVTAAFSGTQTAGNLNIVVVGWNDTTNSVQSVQDSAGNAYALAIGPTTGTGLRQAIYYAPSIRGGSNSVTVTFSGPAAFPDVRILEYSGVSILDARAGASGKSAMANSGTATTTSARELVFGASTVATGTSRPDKAFTSRIITAPNGDLAEDRIVTNIGNYNATAQLTSSGPWVIQMVTFK